MSDAKIYVIRHPDEHLASCEFPFGYFKIGVAKDVRRRLSELQSGTPFHLELVTVIEPLDDAEAVEQALHTLFSLHYHRGEWYSLNPPTAEDLAMVESLSVAQIKAVERNAREAGVGVWELPLLRELRRVERPAEKGV